MAFSGVLDKNHWFKYQKIRLRRFVFGNDQDFVENGVIDTKNCYCCTKKKEKGRKEREKRKGEEKSKKKGRGEKTVHKISGSEPSEREARTTCERMTKKSATSHKVAAPALPPRRF